MKIIVQLLCCVVLLSIGASIVADGIRTKNMLPHYETFNRFQDVTYRQVWHIHTLYKVKQCGQISEENREKMIANIYHLNTQKDSLYSEIQTFPSTLDSLKCYSDSLNDKSNIVFSAYESGYKNIKNDEEPWLAYYEDLKASIRYAYYCSIDMSAVQDEMNNVTWLGKLLNW